MEKDNGEMRYLVKNIFKLMLVYWESKQIGIGISSLMLILIIDALFISKWGEVVKSSLS